MNTVLLRFLKNLLIIPILIYISTLIEIYWSMGSFSEKLSAGDPDSSFSEDAYIIATLTTIILTILFLAFTFIKKTYLKITLELVFLILVWFFWNHSIFVDRESAWSTYLFREEILYVLSLSFFPILVLSIATIFGLNYISKKI